MAESAAAKPLTVMFWKTQTIAAAGMPATPGGERLYVVGDIHGRLDLLDAMLDLIDADIAARDASRQRLVFLGDYVDRGPSSAQVIHRLVEVAGTYEAIFLKGNHEDVLLTFLQTPDLIDNWRAMGGLTTLQSYGIAPPLRPSPAEAHALAKALAAVMPPSHAAFLRSLALFWVWGDYAFMHAGLRPGIPLNRQKEQDLLWIRREFTGSTLQHEKFIVHGHTPVRAPDVLCNRINIDTGAYATGRLSCVVLDEQGRYFLQT